MDRDILGNCLKFTNARVEMSIGASIYDELPEHDSTLDANTQRLHMILNGTKATIKRMWDRLKVNKEIEIDLNNLYDVAVMIVMCHDDETIFDYYKHLLMTKVPSTIWDFYMNSDPTDWLYDELIEMMEKDGSFTSIIPTK